VLLLSSVRGAARDRPGRGRLSALGPKTTCRCRPGEITWRPVTSEHSAELTPAVRQPSASILPAPLWVWWSPTRSPMTIPPAAARRTWTPRPPTTATEPFRRSKPWAPATTSTYSETWLPTGPRWHSGYEPERAATRRAPPEKQQDDAFGNPPRHFPLIAPHRDLTEQTELGPRPNDQRAGKGGAHPHQRHSHGQTGTAP
jgi:hypothetical protein